MPTADQLAHLDIDVPAPDARTVGLLLDAADRVSMVASGADRTAMGAAWLPWADITPTHFEAECDTTYDKSRRELPAEVTQRGFLLFDEIQAARGGLSETKLARMTAMGIDADAGGLGFVSAQFAMELEEGISASAIDLTGSATVVAATAVSMRVGIARLERYLAVTAAKPGIRGVLHLTPDALIIAAADQLVWPGPGGFITATGHRVVADAGHTGVTAPTAGGSNATTDEAWIYATGDVWYSMGEQFGVDMVTDGGDAGSFYQPQNKNRPQSERYGLVGFDPNTCAAALVDVA